MQPNIDSIHNVPEVHASDRATDEASQFLAEKIKDIIHDRLEREKYARLLFLFMISFTFATFLILILAGFQCIKFSLDNSVLITLLTTTFGEIVGLFLVVSKYLFPKR